ncbi:MAG: 3'(2'),5'-bisphosphate nucleotidase CysQ [Balneolaceae bacterium]|nr:3'(2'),5'-bisphosphate nucleotidase CysQ [Balneolaceae bacterium]
MELIKEVIECAQKAGEAILTYYKEEIDVVQKENNSPLTKADLAAHHVIADGLKDLTPDIPILSEEGGIAGYSSRKNWKKYWLVDPLDGTKEFIKKNGEFTVNIALIEDNIPVFGVVYIPAKSITYYGKKGEGSFKIDADGKKARIFSEIPNLNKPLTVVASRSHGSDNLEEQLLSYGVTVGEKIPAGSSLKFCLVAEGKADIYPRMGPTMEWDTAAGDAVFRFSGKNGERPSPITYNKPDLRNSGFIIGLE